LPLEVVIPETAHPSFLKACYYLALKPVIIPVAEDKRADVIAMQAAITDRSILMVCSAPCFPYGVVDPVRKLADVARKNDLLLHVDACMGGFLLPFLEDLDYPVPEFDFRIRGVSSISLDAHKYGYAPKGVSVILYKNRNLRCKQFFVHPDWPGGIFASTTFMGTKSGGPLAGCWAVMKHLGREGYRTIAAQLMETTRTITEGIEKHKDLHVIGNPPMSILSFTSDAGDILQLGDALRARGWHLDYLQFPAALHLTITPLNIGKEVEFLKDLDEILKNKASLKRESRTASSTVKAVRTLSQMLPDTSFDWLVKKAGSMTKKKDDHRMAALYGISGSLKNRNKVSLLVSNLLDGLY
jgi:glutamate/tyrosine decarboxylase-like PLP-dependent enzyme